MSQRKLVILSRENSIIPIIMIARLKGSGASPAFMINSLLNNEALNVLSNVQTFC